MSKLSFYKKCIVSLGLSLVLSHEAYSDALTLESMTYGDLLYAESVESNKGRFDTSLQYIHGLSSPLYVLKGAELQINYELLDRVSVGLSWGWYSSSPTQLQSVLNSQLQQAPIYIDYNSPINSVYTHFNYSLLRSWNNFFGKATLESDFIIGGGPGTTLFSNGVYSPGLVLSVEDHIRMSKRFGLKIGISHFLERQEPSSSFAGRLQLFGGIDVRL